MIELHIWSMVIGAVIGVLVVLIFGAILHISDLS
jgi:hypothetical protein